MINSLLIVVLSSLASLLFFSNANKSPEFSKPNEFDETQEYDPDFKMPQSAMDALFPTTFDEFGEVFEYKGVPCVECNDHYDGPCPLHVLKHVHERPKPHSYQHRRAEKTAPKNILKLEESSIPGAGVGMWAIKKIPKDVVFGPLDGKEYEKEDNVTVDGNYWRIPGTDNTYIDLMDKSKANYLAYINCARNVKEQNLIRYFNETDKKFYFISKRFIPQYSELLADYGTEFRKTIGIGDLDFNRSRDLKRRVFLCNKCLRASYTPVDLMPNHLCPVPSKKDDLWQKVLNNKTIVIKQIINHVKENPNAFRTVYECKVCRKASKNATKLMLEKEMKLHYLRRHPDITEIDSKNLIRDDFVELNKLCYRYYKCNICANQSAGLNWTMAPSKTRESIEFDRFVKEFERTGQNIIDRNKNNPIDQFEDLALQFEPELETTTFRLQLTTPGGVNATRKKHKLNKNFFFKSRDDAQCHFKTLHMPLVNITDVRVMKYRGSPHECSMCGNKTVREMFQLDHHVDFHLNFTEMFNGGLCQLDYRTKKFNEPFIENFNFSHLFCKKCNQYMDTDRNHEPEPNEILDHKLSHINLNLLGYYDNVEKKTVQIGNRIPIISTNTSYVHCGLCSNYTSTNTSHLIHHLKSDHTLQPYHMMRIPEALKPKLECHKCNATFDTKKDLIWHVTKLHKEYYYCVCCGKTNYYRKLHQNHMVRMHNNSTATVLIDEWDKVEKLWTDITESKEEKNMPTFGDSIYTVDSEDYEDPTVPYNHLNSLGN
uniref:Histone-lysine N-methyltransferase PRDM9 n=2 Tax=Cacopsylla melanoneura TaxID=428564 RepID=A0A8D8SMJ5_9HEMI